MGLHRLQVAEPEPNPGLGVRGHAHRSALLCWTTTPPSDASCLGRGTQAKRNTELPAQATAAKAGNQINLCLLGKQKLQLPWRSASKR